QGCEGRGTSLLTPAVPAELGSPRTRPQTGRRGGVAVGMQGTGAWMWGCRARGRGCEEAGPGRGGVRVGGKEGPGGGVEVRKRGRGGVE
ncbi:unnamed protein product, partial [Rangifer tarandus platyrhynchus]